MLSTVVQDDEHNWDLHLPTLMMAYRTSHHETTGATPFSLVYGREAKLPEDILFNLLSVEETNSHGYVEALKQRVQHAYQRVRDHSAIKQKKQKANYDRFTWENTFENGSLVWLHCPAVPRGKSPKFHRPWQGPFKIVKKIGSVVYCIQHVQNPRKRVVVHANRLKRYHCQREDEHSQEDWLILPSIEEQVDESVSPLQTAQENISTEQAMGESEETQNPSSPALRWSTRLRRPPERYGTVVSFTDSDSELEN